MRRRDREVTDLGEIIRIAQSAKILHLGLTDGRRPYVVPLNYGFEFSDGALVFYMHGASEGKKLELIRAGGEVCAELECDVALIPGGELACGYGSAYASIIGWGTAEVCVEESEKIKGLKLLMKTQTGRDFDINTRMAASVTVLKLILREFTAKARPKP